MVDGARQTFLQFFRQNTWFLENDGTMSKFLFGIMNYLISINRLLKNQFLKRNFISTTQTTLRISSVNINTSSGFDHIY